MANWIPVTYALTGSKEELQDLAQKIRTTEEKGQRLAGDTQDPKEHSADVTYFAQLLGSELTYGDLGTYWVYDEDELYTPDWKTTEDGEEYLLWYIMNRHWENPLLREMIEGVYKTIKVFYDAPAGDTNDKEFRYFQPMVKLININGLNYELGSEGTATLNCDDSIKSKVLRIPEQVEFNGTNYAVTGFGDCWADPQYGSPTESPKELEEIFFPGTIKVIGAYNVPLPDLKAIHFAGDIDCIGEYAFCGCKHLTTVEFGGKVGCIDYYAFAQTGIKDIQIPEGTRVDPDAFAESPFGNKKGIVTSSIDIENNIKKCKEELKDKPNECELPF